MNASLPTSPANRVLIIPAAGHGVRFRELGKNYPKCILPVRGEPIIVHAIRMLAEKTGAFSSVVIACTTPEHKATIDEVIEAHKITVPVTTFVVHVPRFLKPGPAVSLNAALTYCDYDDDVTVFLSDMLPTHQHAAHEVTWMATDSWGVTSKEPTDYKRWCMVASDASGMVFYDKPQTPPPTTDAACGVYRYASAGKLRDAFESVVSDHSNDVDGELQFSHLAAEYQKHANRLKLWKFPSNNFQDFGTLEEYLINKGISKSRSFNSVLETNNGSMVVKSSKQYDKIRDEAVWMMNVPRSLIKYVPRVESVDLMRGSFTMEKIRSSNLRDVALYFDRSYDTWVEIFQAISGYLDATDVHSLSTEHDNNKDFWLKMSRKTFSRVGEYDVIPYNVSTWLNNEFAECIAQLIDLDAEDDCVMYYHGDLHFANMFYCFHYKDLKVVDPRGEVRGSVFYDLAKLCHSVFGRYDYIDSDLYRMQGDEAVFYDKGHQNIEQAFRDVIFDKLDDKYKWILLTLTASLFVSMIPLHADKPEHCKLFLKEFERLAELAEMIRLPNRVTA
jgi:dTDP-glucose pyrophosphorylase